MSDVELRGNNDRLAETSQWYSFESAVLKSKARPCMVPVLVRKIGKYSNFEHVILMQFWWL